MATDEFTDTQDLLMDVDNLDFLTEGDINGDGADLSITIDPVSNAPTISFPFEQPSGKALRFKFNNVSSRSLAFDESIDDNKMYPVQLLHLDESPEFTKYVLKLFELYQGLGEHRKNDVPTIGLIKQSSKQEHFSVVNLAFHALVTELELYIESIKNTNKLQRIGDLEECLSILNCLKTIFFITDSPECKREEMLESLINWVNRSDGEPNELVIQQVFDETLLTRRKVYEQSGFWDLTAQLLLRGLWSQSTQCIKNSQLLEHEDATVKLFVTDLITIIESYPLHSESLFREWKLSVLQLISNWDEQDVEIEMKKNLLNIFLILSGSKNKICEFSQYWYESYCGLMLYYIPTLELSHEYGQLATKDNSIDVCNNWETSCYNIINDKVADILPVLESLDLATSAFVAVLCEAKGIIRTDFHEIFAHREELDSDFAFRTEPSIGGFLINQLALTLSSYNDKTLWPVSVGLISLSPDSGDSTKRTILAELLPHFPYSTNDDIEWLLSVCAKWRLPDVAKTIYKILGQDTLYQNNIVEAMSNFSKAGEYEWVKHYSWMIFEASILQGGPLDDITINSIVNGDTDSFNIPKDLLNSVVMDVMRQTLSPYAVLYEFHKFVENNETANAINHMIELLSFPYMPEQYCVILLAKFFYPMFLKTTQTTLDESQVFTVLKMLQRININDACIALYAQVRATNDESASVSLPESLDIFIRDVRKSLNYKLCQAFM
ncbi:unnamed protein product [Kluyveromyces dobzhanskii CBS 2104]|uniref:Nuclear pore complex protein Nup85 n=1 Tax=Kluyveromyces dobzhanskii CBS 2104 TaxID=1427455 RepID=A0A0A8L7R6_9SACH|nr:unnamed protein product [Kluyveromyces dobzhanskii CBS 2104]